MRITIICTCNSQLHIIYIATETIDEYLYSIWKCRQVGGFPQGFMIFCKFQNISIVTQIVFYLDIYTRFNSVSNKIIINQAKNILEK